MSCELNSDLSSAYSQMENGSCKKDSSRERKPKGKEENNEKMFRCRAEKKNGIRRENVTCRGDKLKCLQEKVWRAVGKRRTQL